MKLSMCFPSVKAERLWERCQLCCVGRLTEDVPCCLKDQAGVSFPPLALAKQQCWLCAELELWLADGGAEGGQAVKPAVSLPILGASPCKGNRRPARIGLPASSHRTPENIERFAGKKQKSKPASIVQQLALNWQHLSAVECCVFRKVKTSPCKSAT